MALSGGPDSLALTAAAAAVLPTTALIVDHGLQSGSAEAAAQLILEAGGSVAGFSFLVELGFLGGRNRLQALHSDIRSLAVY